MNLAILGQFYNGSSSTDILSIAADDQTEKTAPVDWIYSLSSVISHYGKGFKLLFYVAVGNNTTGF